MTKDEARAELLTRIHPGDTVFSIVRHVTRRGNRKHIDLLCIDNPPPEIVFITTAVIALLGLQTAPDGTILTRDIPAGKVAILSTELFCDSSKLRHVSL